MLLILKSVFDFFGFLFRFWNGLKKQGKVAYKYSNFLFQNYFSTLPSQDQHLHLSLYVVITLRVPFVPIETDFIERITKR